ncbi:MAG: SAF domain-containing protein [Propionicimonas sp.]|uniref:SAF domain-containing protein n=1 Tax=Propionicimonas sp. TaxID=1955623 RepID=UPI002B201FB7|nr:SAF domain-containing protein [Propionicimonas sp.]MEA4945788.1 SAF domain-containing protein [Propionicimonas sp.]MEA5054372.1 SAF domain-containing protein [Propionicimonas sp.]
MRAFLTSLARAVRWHRRVVAAACAAVAVYAGLTALTDSDRGSVVLAAGHDIDAGHTLAAGDLTKLRLPAEAVPAGALTDPDQAVGRTVVTLVPARAVLTPRDLVTAGSVVAAGRVALPVSFGDAAPLELLRVGDRIDVLGADKTGETAAVAANVRVAALPAADDGGFLGSRHAPPVLLDLSPEEAARVTASAAASTLAFALH